MKTGCLTAVMCCFLAVLPAFAADRSCEELITEFEDLWVTTNYRASDGLLVRAAD